MTQQNTYEDMLAALTWQIDLGADEAIGNAFISRYTQPETKAPVALTPFPVRGPATEAPAPAGPAIGDAQQAAEAADTLEALHAALADFPHPLKEHATQCVFADGNPAARVMLIGEAPGRDEDRLGKPFVGRSGQLLDRILAAIDLSRDAPNPEAAVYIANVIPWRPLRNRTPSDYEVALLLPFIRRQIALATPDVIVLTGASAAKALTGSTEGITRLRGRWTEIEIEGRFIPVLPTLHPAYLLRNPAAKRDIWQDMLSLRTHLDKGKAEP